ncbi:hypothetical protein BaRGS_00003636, partial [Batillaria attramentaria]
MADAYEGLPKQFVASLKILFDILDEEHSGRIRLRDIASRWSDEGVRDLPTGVMEGLRKVTPPNGLLTFDCFVAGLKVALLQGGGTDQSKRRSVSSSGLALQKENRSPPSSAPLSARYPAQQPFSASSSNPLQLDQGSRQNVHPGEVGKQGLNPHRPALQPHHQPQGGKHQGSDGNNNLPRPATAAVKPQPNNSNAGYRRQQYNPPQPSDHAHQGYPAPVRAPPRPERPYNPNIRKSTSGSDLNPPQVPPRDHRQNQKIVNELKNWQRDWANSRGGPHSGRDRSHPAVEGRAEDPQHAIYANIDQFQRKHGDDHMRPNIDQFQRKHGDEGAQQQAHGPGKATVRRHGSGRRHTLQNGVDQNMIKRMQQLEEEMAMLKQGMEMVDVARDWYLRQLAAVQDKQRMLGRVNYNDNSLEAHQERMNFQRARITEVNMQLRTLVDSSEKGFPLHMNLAVTSSKDYNSDAATVKMVKEQNRRLTQEVSDKSEKISKLEQEKASLIRELFDARTKNKTSYDDTT